VSTDSAGRILDAVLTLLSDWKNVVDNFLKCYHCHVAEAGKQASSAYDVFGATVNQHAV
jgi:carnitine monooxygenase subunit